MLSPFYSYRHYLGSLILFTAITIICQLFRGELEMINIALMHLLPVIMIALKGNISATMIITAFSVIILAVFYIPPKFSILVNEFFYIWSFVIFFIVGYIITRQAQKIHMNSIKETLLNTLSHDLKTPLSSITGNAILLLQDNTLQPQTIHDILLQIKDSSLRMNRLITNLLESARLQNTNDHLDKQWCDFEDLLGVALHEFRNDALDHQFDINIQHDLPLFFGDCSLLARLLVNLIDNGLKYTLSGKKIKIQLSANSKFLNIMIYNESQPIKKSDLKNMFNKFYRLENSADIDGSGIGLSICQQIVDFHHGTIEAYNMDSGISIEVRLPISKKTMNV